MRGAAKVLMAGAAKLTTWSADGEASRKAAKLTIVGAAKLTIVGAAKLTFVGVAKLTSSAGPRLGRSS